MSRVSFSVFDCDSHMRQVTVTLQPHDWPPSAAAVHRWSFPSVTAPSERGCKQLQGFAHWQYFDFSLAGGTTADLLQTDDTRVCVV